MGRRPGASRSRGGDTQEEISLTVRNRRVRLALALAACSATLTLAAACGGSGPGGDDNGAPAAGGQDSAFAAYTDCLKQQGIDVLDSRPSDRPFGRPSGRPSGAPGPGGSGRPSGAPSPGASGRPGGGQPGGFAGLRPAGVDDATWQKAQEACRSVLPTGGAGPGGNGRNGGGQGTNPAYANGLSDHGVPAGTTPDSSDPKVTEALQACKALSPAPSPAG